VLVYSHSVSVLLLTGSAQSHVPKQSSLQKTPPSQTLRGSASIRGDEAHSVEETEKESSK